MKTKLILLFIVSIFSMTTSHSFAWNGVSTFEVVTRETIADTAMEMINATWISPAAFRNVEEITGPNRAIPSYTGWFAKDTQYTGVPYTQGSTEPFHNPPLWSTLTKDEFITVVSTTAGFDAQLLFESPPHNQRGLGNDCSGFVSICWKLTSRYKTPDFVGNNLLGGVDGQMYALGQVGEGQQLALIKGDAFVAGESHILLFDEYHSDKTGFSTMEQVPDHAQKRSLTWAKVGSYQPIRRNKIDEGFPIGVGTVVTTSYDKVRMFTADPGTGDSREVNGMGVIVDGPQYKDSYKWWKVSLYEQDIVGWISEGFLRFMSAVVNMNTDVNSQQMGAVEIHGKNLGTTAGSVQRSTWNANAKTWNAPETLSSSVNWSDSVITFNIGLTKDQITDPVRIDVFKPNGEQICRYYFPLLDVCPPAWYSPYIFQLWKQGVITGSGDRCFYPNNKITRAELLKIAVQTAKQDGAFPATRLQTYRSDTFSDVPESAWFQPSVKDAYEMEVVEGYKFVNETVVKFLPDNPVKRAEAVKIVLTAFRLYDFGDVSIAAISVPSFTDVANKNDWYYCYVETAKRKQIINGYSDGTFAPNATMTRSEAAKVVYNASAIRPR